MSYAALFQIFAQELIIPRDGHAAQFHLSLLQFIVIPNNFLSKSPSESMQLVITADDLQPVAWEEHIVALRDIEPSAGPKYTTHMHTKSISQRQFFQRLTRP